MAPQFSHHAETFPMVLGQGGLVLFEKVIKTEGLFIDRMSKPKSSRALSADKTKGKGQEAGPSTSATISSSPSPSSSPLTQTLNREHDWKGTWPKNTSIPSSLPSHAPSTSSTSSPSLKYGIKVKMTPSKEQQELTEYLQREKGLISKAYTWGGRLPHTGPSAHHTSESSGLSRQTWALGTKKPPLRL